MNYSASRSVSVLLDSRQESISVVAAMCWEMRAPALTLMPGGLKGSGPDGYRNHLTP